MNTVDDLIAFLNARLDEDESWARAANRPYEYADEGSVAPSAGVHWHWVAGEDWTVVTLDPVIDEFVAEPGHNCNLTTVEEWPSHGRPMPRAYANSIVEMDASAAGHIVRHDPARVLADVAAKRAIIELHAPLDLRAANYGPPRMYDIVCQMCAGGEPYPCPTLRLLGSAYAGYPDYRKERKR